VTTVGNTQHNSQTRSVDDATPTSVCVAIVLYENSLEEVWRCLRALHRSAEHALDDPQLPLAALRINIGDCSDQSLIGREDLEAIRSTLDSRITVDYSWFGRNLGHSAGSNALADQAPEDALLFFNPDTYAAPNLVEMLVRAMRRSDIAAVDARQLPCEHPKWFDPVVGDQSWASGACLLVRTLFFREVDGFDAETFPSYVNDVDLSWRLRLHSGRVVHEPKAVVFHDKRLDRFADVRPTSIELHEGLLGRLLLATKYDRDDIVSQTVDVVREHGTTEQRRAVREFERRRSFDQLPQRIANASAVAEFTDGEYGHRRF
jgi:GT2 family glycosyltransferase